MTTAIPLPEAPEPPAPADARGEPFTLTSVDGAALGARLFLPASLPRTAVAVLGGTAIPQRYYAAFARHLASRGHAALTFDYRGVGASRPASLVGYRATMHDWGRFDIEAALAWLARRFPGATVTAVAHSFGGQGLGLAPSAPDLVRAAVLVGAQSGDTALWPARLRARNELVFRALVPAVTAALGYFPGRLGMGEDLPAGVIREWARWCSTRGYLTAHVPAAERFHGALKAPLLAVSVADDDYAPERALDELLGWYRRCPVEKRALTPREAGRPVGHFGYFRQNVGGAFWDEATRFLERSTRG